MVKKTRTIVGETAALVEAADQRLDAAKKIAQADALMGEDPTPQFSPADFTPEAPAEPELSKMERVISELHGEGKFEVYKLIGGAAAKIGVFQIGEWPERMETIARQHGGGEFKVVFKNKQGYYQGQDIQTYDPKAYGNGELAAPLPLGNPAADAALTRVLEMMEKREASTALEIATLRKEQSALMLKLVESRATPERSTEDILAMVKLAKELAPAPASSPLESIKEILEVVSVLRDGGSVGEAPSPLTTAVNRAFEILTPLIGAYAKKLAKVEISPVSAPGERPARALPPPQAAPSLKVDAPLVEAPRPSPIPNPEIIPAPENGIVQYAASLYSAAAQNMEAESVGDSIMALIPEEDLDAFADMMEDPGLIGSFLTAEPRLVQHQAWLVRLVNHVKIQLTPDDELPAAQAEPAPAVGGQA